MLERIVKSFVFILLVGTLFDGCAYFSKSGRQQLAYERYVRKCSKNRDRQRSKMKAPQIPAFAPSEPRETTQLGPSPESVTASGQSQPVQGEFAPARDEGPTVQIESP